MAVIHFDTDLFTKMFKEYRGSQSQADIAEEFGLGRSTISLLENGKQAPTLDTLKTFCEKANEDFNTFFFKEEEDPVLLLMGQLRESDKDHLLDVLERIKVREHYIAINKRCEK